MELEEISSFQDFPLPVGTETPAGRIVGAARKLGQGLERKWRVRVQAVGDPQATTSLIFKEPNSFWPPIGDDPPAQRLYANWFAMKNAGLQVVPNMWKISDTLVAMTDITTNGSGIYGKADIPDDVGGKYKMVSTVQPTRTPLATDGKLLTIPLSAIEEKAKEEAVFATKHNIILPHDSGLVLVVSPDGNWYPLNLDIGTAHVGATEHDIWGTIEAANRQFVNRFVNEIAQVQMALQKVISYR